MKIDITYEQCSLILTALTEEIKALEVNYIQGKHSEDFYKTRNKELLETYSLILKASKKEWRRLHNEII